MQSRNFLHNQSGQATIFMAIFITTMILLFAFTTNIGMLVHAKINLQNAADSAAYAGAAVQARQMTAISFLNYEMRRANKQFLHNWMVRGNRAQSCFPRSSSGLAGPALCNAAGFQTDPNDKYLFSYRDPRPAEAAYNEPIAGDGIGFVPTTCIVFDRKNNFCQKSTVAGIPELGGLSGVLNFVNPIINQVRRSTALIIDKKIQDCLSKSGINRFMLFYWVFNIDPIPPPVVAQGRQEFPFPVIGTLDGIGALPRLAILRARIDNFEEALNLDLQDESFPSATIKDETIGAILGDPRRDYFERPIQAYLSARNNLPQVADQGIFSEVRLTELVPQVTNVPQNPRLGNLPVLFKLNDIKDNVNVAFSDFRDRGVDGAVRDRGECQQFRVTAPVPSWPIGVTKEPTILTFYAINLKARARLLFSPFGLDGSVDLNAYAAAKPFGSRIGKNLNANPENLIHSYGRKVHTDVMTGIFKNNHQFVNLQVSDLNRDTETDGFASNGNLGYLERAIRVLSHQEAYRLAGAYNPYEIGYYNVPANYSGIGRFPSNPSFSNNNKFEIRAPLLPFKRNSTSIGFLRRRIEEYFTTDGFLDLGDNVDELSDLKATYLNDSNFQQLEQFLIRTGTLRVHLMPDPILRDVPRIRAYAQNEGRDFSVAGQAQAQLKQLTSWNTTKSAGQAQTAGTELGRDIGRNGYSVRFVAFRNLINEGISTNDRPAPFYDDPFSRLGPSDAAAQRILNEIQALQH